MQFNKDIKSEHKELFLEARKLLLGTKGIVEIKKDRITTYSDSEAGICHMRTMKYGIDIGFLKGARMEDKYGLLTGNGKVMRVVPLKKMNKAAIKYYLKQALALNREK